MTKSQIKAELRRSACEDDNPFLDVEWIAFCDLTDFEGKGEWMESLEKIELRIFFLLVAEAL